ncbi:MAG: hypothetical protein JWO41_916 [Candidatus Saccharibacteria bacterium]|nr:hypothetical protein [Candidatus Saccharibacteria bacterium]
MRKIHCQQKTVAIVFFLVIAVLSVVFLWAQSDNQARITSGRGQAQKAIKLTPQTLRNPDFSFDYPGIYHIGSQITQSPDLADYILIGSTSYEKRLTVTLEKNDMYSLSGYSLRRTRSDLYSSQTLTLPSGVASVWTKIDMTEVTAFLPHNDMVATISVSVQNTNATDGLSAEMADILNSFRWQ